VVEAPPAQSHRHAGGAPPAGSTLAQGRRPKATALQGVDAGALTPTAVIAGLAQQAEAISKLWHEIASLRSQ